MIAQVAGLDFGRYALWCIAPVIFALGSAYGIIWAMSRRYLALASPAPAVASRDLQPFDRPHTIKGLVILVLVIALSSSAAPQGTRRADGGRHSSREPQFRTEDILRLVDWPILVLFMSLFVVTGAFESIGYGDHGVEWLGRAASICSRCRRWLW